MAMMAVLWLALPAVAGEGIRAVQEDGRTVYVNDESPKAPVRGRAAHSRPRRQLVYWSRSENRWKPVPPATRGAILAARSAAADVNQYLAGIPRAPKGLQPTSNAVADPVNRALMRDRAITSAQLDAIIDEAAGRHGVDPNLVRAVIKVESNFNPKAVSRAGAMGLMQLMPSTARSLGVSRPFDPQQNVDGGVRHLKTLLDSHGGDVTLSLASYNAGAGAVRRYNGVPPYSETRNYVRRITEMYGGGGRSPGSSRAPIVRTRTGEGTIRFSNTD